MRYIDLNGSGGPTDSAGLEDTAWTDEAKLLLQKLLSAPDKVARDAILDSEPAPWGRLRDWLLRLSHDKCWYSEARDSFSVLEVEHFRPKKRRKRKVKQDDGYWWLAFEWSNYRLCGKVGNSKKGDLFPLAPASPVATYGGTTILNEIPLLLDPACPADPDLLTFDEDGACGPHADADPFTQLRVTTTVTCLNLNHGRVKKSRQRIWAKCWQLITECRTLAPIAASPAEKATMVSLKDQLRKMVLPEAEFSATAKDCLLKSNIGWAAKLATG